jgi:biopolymer transport protein TolR
MGANVPEDPFDPDVDFAPLAEINVTPFVDVMLVLLIIFMVTAPLMLAGVPVKLPQTVAARQNPPEKPLVITLGADGSLHIRNEAVAPETLIARLAALRNAEGDGVAYVRADTSIPYGQVMAVLGAVTSAGYGRVSLLALRKAGG